MIRQGLRWTRFPVRVRGASFLSAALIPLALATSTDLGFAETEEAGEEDAPSTVEFSIVARPRPRTGGGDPFFRRPVGRSVLDSGLGTAEGTTPALTRTPIPFGRTLWVEGGGSTYPADGVRMRDGTRLSAENALFYGSRRVELSRRGTALKGADLVGSVGLFAGAMASSFGLLDEKQALWLAGGAAALGAAYGVSVGFERRDWREEWRWPEER